MQPTSLRDVRLDFARGLAMFIIFMSHMWGNAWAAYIPRAYGPTDAAEWFVFCSGFASALAFGRVFEQRSWLMGTSRIGFRLWQLYWAQIAVFVLVAALCVLATDLIGGRDYVRALNLQHFFNSPDIGLVHLLTLTYVPNYFDILPMYMVVLAMIPVIMGLHKLNPWLALAFPPMLYLAARAFDWNLPAEWWSERPWFFNPFTWQLLFFTGFAFGRGWLHCPAFTWPWLTFAGAIMIVLFIFDYNPIRDAVPAIHAVFHDHHWLVEKTDFGPLRYIHMLATAFLALAFFAQFPEFARWRGFEPIVTVGQQTLPVFLSTIPLSWAGGVFLDVFGRTATTVPIANLGGFALMIAVAHICAYYKSEPWRRARHKLEGSQQTPPKPALAAGAGD